VTAPCQTRRHACRQLPDFSRSRRGGRVRRQYLYARFRKAPDWRSELAGGIKFQSQLPRHVLDFSLDGKVVNYAEHTEQDYANVRAKLESALHFDNAHTLSASVLSALEHEERDDPSYPLTALGPIEVLGARAAVGIPRDVGRLYGTLSATAESWDFKDAIAVNGDLLDQDRAIP
jgi:hypothetical protein